MKASAYKKDIVDAARKAVTLIPNTSAGRTSLVYLQAKADMIRLAVSYPDITFSTEFRAECTDPSAVPTALYGRKFFEIIKQTAHKVELEEEHAKFSIKSETSKWIERPVRGTLKTLEPPTLPTSFVDANALASAFEDVKYTAGKDTLKPSLYLVDVIDGKVRASNGTNYHEVRTGCKGLTFQISNTHVDSFLKLLKVWNGEIGFLDHGNHYYFTHGHDVLSLTKLNVRFPDLDRMLIRPLKAQATYVLKIVKSDAESAIRKVRLSSADKFPYIEMHLSQNECLFRCVGDSGEEAVSSIEARWDANPRIATFNTNHLYDCITNAEKDVLEIRFRKDNKDGKSPLTIEGETTWSLVTQLKMRAR